MKNLNLLKIALLAGVLVLLSGISSTAFCQDDYEGQFEFRSITKGYEYNAPDFIALSKYDGEKATVYRQRTHRFGMTSDMYHVSTGVFEYGFGHHGSSLKTGERITFLSLNKLVYENTHNGTKAIYTRKKEK